ncbi:MAG: SMC family ATPase [Nitrososphaerota archaeon]|nr:SMC family ATPase [Nitrososphaerota archaeon]
MIVRRLALKNIRSYGDPETVVGFPEGAVLFEGDIGSGKSSLLYAIEFALFGLGEMSGGYLLSEAAEAGYVHLAFASRGKEYEVHRGLRRKKAGVGQEECYMTDEGGRKDLSPSELKERVIEVLGFNEPPSPKAGSLIYRFSVFTPQEQMKEIITRSPDERLQTLRRIFGIEEYKTAAENAKLLAREVADRAGVLAGETADLEEKEGSLRRESEELAALERGMPGAEARRSKASGAVEELEAAARRLQDDRARLNEVTGRIPELEDAIGKAEASIGRYRRKVESDRGAIASRYLPEMERFEAEAPPAGEGVEAVRAELKAAEERLAAAGRREGAVEAEARNVATLLKEGRCPVCGQRIRPEEFGERSSHLQRELAEAREEAAGAKDLASRIAGRLDLMKAYEERRKRMGELRREKEEAEARIADLEKSAAEAESYLGELRDRLLRSKAEAEHMARVHEEIRRLDEELRRARAELAQAEAGLAAATARRAEKERVLLSLEAEVRRKREKKEKMGGLNELKAWLSEYFVPVLEEVERRVMADLNRRFNQQFQRFFSALIDDPEMRVRVDEEFSPVFERQGFTQEFEALSGGERTSMALAYRLALNRTVQEVAASGAGELAILDEPTDGFSKEELHKMRGLLGELNCRQVIIVSHERELEAMVDSVVKVEKVDGRSRLSEG